MHVSVYFLKISRSSVIANKESLATGFQKQAITTSSRKLLHRSVPLKAMETVPPCLTMNSILLQNTSSLVVDVERKQVKDVEKVTEREPRQNDMNQVPM